MDELKNDYPAKLRVAIQGVPGAFHDMAARQYFPENNIEIVACDTFRDAFDAVLENKADSAMVAIENSLAGSLLPNYTLLKNSGLLISGEIYLRIEQNFMALPGQTIDDIKEVHSHPIAIIQCDEFLEPLRKKGVKIIDSIDTALSARLISENKLKATAAIASDLAAGMYNLEIIKQGVETNKRNFTRFLSLAPETLTSKIIAKRGKRPDKASVCFSLPHQTGSLSQILSVFAFYKINLTKIQSAPIVGTEWEYFFYIDLMFSDYEMYIKALVAVKPLIDQLQILGEYISGKP
jgi:prephenate dehydratase